MTKLSIAIPTWEYYCKGQEFLNNLLQTIEIQTFKDFEVVISDHSINDDLVSVINNFKDKFEIKYIKNENKRGCSPSNLNNAIDNCSGNIVKIMFQDDFFYDNKALEKIYNSLYNSDEMWLLNACNHTVDNGHSFYWDLYPRFNDKLLDGTNTLSSPSVLSFKREVKNRFDENLVHFMDIDFFYGMRLDHGDPIFLDDVLVTNRFPNEYSISNNEPKNFSTESKYCKDKYGVPMINFVIPSIGRETLKYTLQSIINQTDSDWECWVGFDGLSENQVNKEILIKDSRIHYIYLTDKIGSSAYHGNAGLVRNEIISRIDNNKKWIGFVDDDDTIQKEYIEIAKKLILQEEFDVCIFRMRYDKHGIKILPPPGMNQIQQNYVGISFFVNKEFIDKNNIKFINDNAEDFQYLFSISECGGKVSIAENIMYNVNGHLYEKNDDSYLTDKNKLAYKLKDFGPIYCINLDRQSERWDYMEKQFKHWELSDYTRISAYDGREDNLDNLLAGRYPDRVTSCEIGCVISHLKAIKYWYENSDSPYAIIMEDDCDLDIAKFWEFTWSDFIAKIPYDYDVIQLAIICNEDLHVKLHKRFVNEFSTAAYVIARHHAEKILKYHICGDKYKLDNGVKPRAVADDLVYNSGNTFSIPLLLYNISLGSSIHPEHIDTLHRKSYDRILNFWQRKGSDLKIDILMDYDPHLGRTVDIS